MTTAEKLTKAKIKLLLDKPAQPFFAQLVMSMKVITDDSVTKAASDGQTIKFNSQYADSLTLDELKGTICTAVMEAALLHPQRRNGRDTGTWSKACQLAANQIVKDNGLHLPKDALFNPKFKGLSAEDIFKQLPAPKPDDKPGESQPDPNGKQQGKGNQQEPGEDNGNMQVQDSPAETESERQEEESKMKQKVAQAALTAKKAGHLPGFMEEMINELLTPVINWKEVINRFIIDIARNDYSFSRPNTRFLHTGFIMPSLYNIEPNNIIILNDCSGSMNKSLCQKIGSEVTEAAQQINAGLTLINVNTEVVGEPLIVEQGEALEFIIQPSGGTDFAPGFDYIEEKGLPVTAVLYMTDGDCNSYPETEPDFPVLWIVYDNPRFTPSFGEVIHVSEQD